MFSTNLNFEAGSQRAHVVSVALDLHRQQNYIASIPLFLAQADGICSQEIGTFLFAEHQRRTETVENRISRLGEKQKITSVVLSALIWKTQIGSSIDHCKPSDKDNGPNRNGIVHGSRKHLDYGTRINSLKAFSLLAFVSILLDQQNGFGQLLIKDQIS
jgi:hypothetical protein